MKLKRLVIFAQGWILLAPALASAALPELQVAPLRYDENLQLGHPKDGVIDAANPTGSTVHVKFEVQAFRQINDLGELEFYDDERIAAAVTPATPEFDLGPREAIRTRFTIDPNRLGPGGAYGVIFLRTIPAGAAGTSQISTSARVGTLLILSVGDGGQRAGHLTGLKLPKFFQYGGSSIHATYYYHNTGAGAEALAFAPTLEAGINGTTKKTFTGPLAFPGRLRTAEVTIPTGNNFGPSRVTLSDATGDGPPVVRGVFLVTGFWTWLFPLLLLVLIGLMPFAWVKKFLIFLNRARLNFS